MGRIFRLIAVVDNLSRGGGSGQLTHISIGLIEANRIRYGYWIL